MIDKINRDFALEMAEEQRTKSRHTLSKAYSGMCYFTCQS